MLGGECDNKIVVLKLITNLVEGNNFGVEVKGLSESSKSRLAEALATFISIDDVRALVTMGELGRGARDSFPTFDKKYTEACVIEGAEILTLRLEKRGTNSVQTQRKIPKENGDRL